MGGRNGIIGSIVCLKAERVRWLLEPPIVQAILFLDGLRPAPKRPTNLELTTRCSFVLGHTWAFFGSYPFHPTVKVPHVNLDSIGPLSGHQVLRAQCSFVEPLSL